MMTEQIGLYLFWALAIAAIFFAFVNQREPGRSSTARPLRIGGLPNIAGILGLALFMLLLTSCATPTVIATPNSCTTLIPENWRAGVPGAPLPAGDTVGDWISFGDAQTGKLDQANGRTTDTIGIIERCEERDEKAVKRATRRWWQIL